MILVFTYKYRKCGLKPSLFEAAKRSSSGETEEGIEHIILLIGSLLKHKTFVFLKKTILERAVWSWSVNLCSLSWFACSDLKWRGQRRKKVNI